MDFLFHKVSEKERETIKKQAKSVIDSFSKKLSRVSKTVSESLVERDKGERDEREGKKESDENFSREIMFENAPQKNNDFILSEKKKW